MSRIVIVKLIYHRHKPVSNNNVLFHGVFMYIGDLSVCTVFITFP
jgi:hypothetical protein